ncbi:MAG: XRE family transcriptional regulator [Acidobacteria bacterium]|nr:MAG: XRE family transcriptional regulator [Acidobacteriota bacterium]
MGGSNVDWGERIKEYRALNGMTQEAFAEQFGVDRTTVSRWERGQDEPSLVFRKRLRAMTLTLSESVLRSLIDHIDGLDGFATLVDGKFRVVRTSRSHQALLRYDVSEIYGTPSDRYWSQETEKIIADIGGLGSFRRNGIYCMDLTVVRQPHESGFGNDRPLASIGRTVAIGDPRDAIGYLTTLRFAENVPERPHVVVKSLDDQG